MLAPGLETEGLTRCRGLLTEIGPQNARSGKGRFGFGGSLAVKTIGHEEREGEPRKNEKSLVLHILSAALPMRRIRRMDFTGGEKEDT